jgi:hypothetical protein
MESHPGRTSPKHVSQFSVRSLLCSRLDMSVIWMCWCEGHTEHIEILSECGIFAREKVIYLL